MVKQFIFGASLGAALGLVGAFWLAAGTEIRNVPPYAASNIPEKISSPSKRLADIPDGVFRLDKQLHNAYTEALQTQVAALRKELEAANVRIAFADAQAEMADGVFVPWSGDIHPSYRPNKVGELVRSAIAKAGGQLLELDCEEFPCIPYIQSPKSGGSEWSQSIIEALMREYADAGMSPSVSAMGATMEDGDGPRHIVGLAITDSQWHDENLRVRANSRFQRFVSKPR